MKNVKIFAKFIAERYSIFLKKEKGFPKPWTKDPILLKYKFCNICREWDTETKWIAENWRNKYSSDADLWFAMMVARYINWHPTLAKIGYPNPWNKDRLIKKITEIEEAGDKVWTGAYIVSTNGSKESKVEYVASMLDKAYSERRYIRPREGDTLQSFYDRIVSVRGVGQFMAGQVIADLKYVNPLMASSDWKTFAVSGPGSRRGLNRVYGNSPERPWVESEWKKAFDSMYRYMEDRNMLVCPLHAQDLQNCLCEFDKYMRVKLGEGRPRSLYNGVN